MNRTGFFRSLLLLLLFTAVFAFSIGASSDADMETVSSGDCLACHEGYDATLDGSIHAVGIENSGVKVSCADCHSGAKAHIDNPDVSTITNPGTAGFEQASAICSSCHMTNHQQRMAEGNPHSKGDLNCSACHKIHGNTRAGLLSKPEPSLCYSCHSDVEVQFAQPYRHPVSNGIVTCSECHKAMDEHPGSVNYAGVAEVCVNCHGQFQGPFPYEHQATVDYSVEQGGCLNCHEAHGSDLPRMLKQTYNSPDFQVCSQCHLVPGHQNNSFHGNQWAGLDCYSCHVDIHGSYTNKLFLAPELETQGCFNIGCHQR